MVAYGVLVGFVRAPQLFWHDVSRSYCAQQIHAVSAAKEAIDPVVALQAVYSSGVMGFAFCLATAVWELKFLLWRKRSSQGSTPQEQDALLNFSY